MAVVKELSRERRDERREAAADSYTGRPGSGGSCL